MEEYGFADRLKAARARAGWSQTELGKRSGVHAMAISRLERGEKKDVTGATLRKLALTLQVSGDYLLGLTEEIERVSPRSPKRPRSRTAAPVG
jgi:transcriptional regulator with XRE-family HTH domain